MRALSAEEAALWERVTREVRALRPRPPSPPPKLDEPAAPLPSAQPAPAGAPRPATAPPRARPGATLDATWDRKLALGLLQPDLTVDLHGHDLRSAYEAVDAGLARACATGARVLLLITGKPRTGEGRPGRGAIRAAVGDWLHASRHASRIAAVRNAAPRHGGAGALYIVLRRTR